MLYLMSCALFSVALGQYWRCPPLCVGKRDVGNAALQRLQQTVKSTVTDLVAKADTNGNEEFDRYDADKDGSVSEKEFMTRFTHNAAELNMVAKGLFLELDMDRSGIVTRSDIDLYYRKIDKDHNGHVSKMEFDDYFPELLKSLKIHQLKSQQTHTTAPTFYTSTTK